MEEGEGREGELRLALASLEQRSSEALTRGKEREGLVSELQTEVSNLKALISSLEEEGGGREEEMLQLRSSQEEMERAFSAGRIRIALLEEQVREGSAIGRTEGGGKWEEPRDGDGGRRLAWDG